MEVEAAGEVEGPIDRGEPLGEAIVTRRRRAGAGRPSSAASAVPAASVAERVDSALPGPALVAWLLVGLALAGGGRRGDLACGAVVRAASTR